MQEKRSNLSVKSVWGTGQTYVYPSLTYRSTQEGFLLHFIALEAAPFPNAAFLCCSTKNVHVFRSCVNFSYMSRRLRFFLCFCRSKKQFEMHSIYQNTSSNELTVLYQQWHVSLPSTRKVPDKATRITYIHWIQPLHEPVSNFYHHSWNSYALPRVSSLASSTLAPIFTTLHPQRLL